MSGTSELWYRSARKAHRPSAIARLLSSRRLPTVLRKSEMMEDPRRRRPDRSVAMLRLKVRMRKGVVCPVLANICWRDKTVSAFTKVSDPVSFPCSIATSGFGFSLLVEARLRCATSIVHHSDLLVCCCDCTVVMRRMAAMRFFTCTRSLEVTMLSLHTMIPSSTAATSTIPQALYFFFTT